MRSNTEGVNDITQKHGDIDKQRPDRKEGNRLVGSV